MFCSNADFTKAQKSIETKVNTFFFMYMNSCDVIICYLEILENSKCFPNSLGIRDIEVGLYYNPNIELVNDNVYTKFYINLSFRSQDMTKNQIMME